MKRWLFQNRIQARPQPLSPEEQNSLLTHHRGGAEVHFGDNRCLAAAYKGKTFFVNKIQDYRRGRPHNPLWASLRHATNVFNERASSIPQGQQTVD